MMMRFKETGLTLIEMMIALILGLLVTSAILAVFISNVKSSSENIKMMQLNQELRAVMNFMSDEIKRAGYSADPSVSVFIEDFQTPTVDCVIYSYDTDGDGIQDVNERFGFKLTNNAIDWTDNRTNATCTTGDWRTLTSDGINISEFKISNKPASTATITVLSIDITITGERDLNSGIAKRTFKETIRIRNEDAT